MADHMTLENLFILLIVSVALPGAFGRAAAQAMHNETRGQLISGYKVVPMSKTRAPVKKQRVH